MNCKPGDMAMCVALMEKKTNPDALGKVVEITNKSNPEHKCGFTWWVVDPKATSRFDAKGCRQDQGWYADRCLMPIRPDDHKEEENPYKLKVPHEA